jgi:hypothetical protein
MVQFEAKLGNLPSETISAYTFPLRKEVQPTRRLPDHVLRIHLYPAKKSSHIRTANSDEVQSSVDSGNPPPKEGKKMKIRRNYNIYAQHSYHGLTSIARIYYEKSENWRS